MMDAPTPKAAHLWARDPLDWYVEPVRATEQLLRVERFVGAVHDPACGQGNIVRALIAGGYTGSDVATRVRPGSLWFRGEVDFLADHSPRDNIVCNPPFFRAKGAETFTRQALAVATGKVCMFMDVRLLAGAERADGLYAEHPPSRVWVVTPRVSCPPGVYLDAGGKAGNGSSDYAWFVWDQTAPAAATTLGWLRRDAA